MGFFEKLKSGLAKTRAALITPIEKLFSSADKVDDDFYDELLDLLIMADVGVETSDYIVDTLRADLKAKNIWLASEAKEVFRRILSDTVGEYRPLELSEGLNVILVIGVNGAGKTTSIGKLASMYASEGKKVILAAADTFRAAAIDQLAVWADRAGVQMIRQSEGADPAAVVFDAAAAARKQSADILIVDTAGRLHNKKNLLDELAKINRVIDRELPAAHRETLIVLDATTGQNALIQTREFGRAAGITGLILTKLDGTAKGGFVLAIRHMLGIPVRFIGVGEGIDDLRPFSPDEFIKALV
ncbi:MAG: signal recognition particle-docking protein FtsY [Clostridiales bacterium]|nr:signal recognition particle-docking protein FtsY [Clostridiales bacterium]